VNRHQFATVLFAVGLAVATSSHAIGARQQADKTGQAPARVAEATDIVIGKSLTFQSTVLAQPVRLDIALPPGYDAGQEHYPVLFAFQNTLAGVFGIVDAMGRAAAVPRMIVVSAGVPGELFALYPREGVAGSGGGPQVLEFLRRELEPFIDATYRTVPYRIVLSHSASALFSLWAMFSAPDAIQAVLAAGPMFAEYDYVRVASMIERALASRAARSQFLFFTQGNQPDLTRDLAAFREMLRARPAAGLVWEFDPEPMSNHNSLGIRTLHDGLWKLYADWSVLPETIASAGGPAIRAHRKALAGRFGYDIGLSPLADNYVRAKWTAEGNHDAVVALARFGCEEWPKDHRRRLQLAFAFEGASRWKDAVPAWEAAIAVLKANVPEQGWQNFLPLYERRLAEARLKTVTPKEREEPREVFDPQGRLLTEGRIFAIATDDLDGDGRPDIAVSDYLNPARILFNDASLQFTRVVTLKTTAEMVDSGHGVAIADFNGDKRLDLFLVYNEGRPSRLLFGDGKGGFTDSGRAIGAPGLNGTSVRVADVDADGDVDAFVTYYQERARLYLNDGKGSFTVSDQALDNAVTLGDLDGDGDVDLLSLAPGGAGPASIWLNTKGRFSQQERTIDVGQDVAVIGLVDVDGDGDFDLVAVARSASSTLWENAGRGSFRKLAQTFEPGTRVAAGDIDLDGDQDLVIGTGVYLNAGGGRFDKVQTLNLGNLPTVLLLVDIDKDGDLDLVAARGSRETGKTQLLLFANTLRRR